MMAMLAMFAYVRVLNIWSYWPFSKVAKVANFLTGAKVAMFGLAAVGGIILRTHARLAISAEMPRRSAFPGSS
jgi:hypothetical protein